MRVFAASSIDRFKALRELFDDLSNIPGCRLVRTPQLHLTFRFFGELEGKSLENTRTNFRQISGQKFTLALLGLGAFPNAKSARVLFLKSQNNKEINSNWTSIAELKPSTQKDSEFVPHITVARFRNRYDCRNLEKKYEGLKKTLLIERISLYRSDLGKDGPTYTEIETIQLK